MNNVLANFFEQHQFLNAETIFSVTIISFEKVKKTVCLVDKDVKEKERAILTVKFNLCKLTTHKTEQKQFGDP